MTVRCMQDVIFLEGVCPVEDAEPLLVLFQEKPERRVDLSQCRRVHSAVIQVLLAARPSICGAPPPGFVHKWIVPIIAGDAP